MKTINIKNKELKTFPLYNHTKIPKVKWLEFDGEIDDKATGYGINCGKSDLIVIDIDMHGDINGKQSWSKIVQDKTLPETLIVKTPNDGYHYYFTSKNKEIRNSAGLIGEGIDVRANGGYIIGPESEVKNDKGEIKTYVSNESETIAPLPDFLEKIILENKTKSKNSKPTKNKNDVNDKKVSIDETKPSMSIEESNKLIGEKIGDLFSAKEGERNDKLNSIAYGLLLQGVDIENINNTLTPVAIGIGLEEDEVNKTLRSAYSAFLNKNRKENEAKENENKNGYYTDMFLADRISLVLKEEKFAYLSGGGIWRKFNFKTGVWDYVHDDEIKTRIKELCKQEFDEAVKSSDVESIKSAMRCLNSKTVIGVLSLVKLNCKVNKDLFDTHKHLLVVENGVVNLKTKELTPFDDKLYLTKYIALPYDPTITSEYVDEILDALPDDAIEWFLIMAGQAITGCQPSDDIMMFLNGIGANGKSTLLNLLAATAGMYGGFPPQDSLMRTKANDSHNLMAYRGLRQAIVEEIPDKQLDTVRLKGLTGTAKVTARELYKDYETFELQCTIFVTCNILPQVLEYDNGTWRRIVLIPFNKVYKKNKEDIVSSNHRLANNATRHASKSDRNTHIDFLARRIEGAYQWYKAGEADPKLPDSIVEATNHWRESGDNIKNWFNKVLKKDDGKFVLVDDLRNSYNSYLSELGYAPISHKVFIERLSNHEIFSNSGYSITHSRVGKLEQSLWFDPKHKNDVSYEPKKANALPTHVKYLSF